MLLQNFILFSGILAFSLMQNIVTEAVSVEEFLSLTTSEKDALDKFRARVEPLLTSDRMKQDVYLIRWLRSKNFDVNAADKMLRDSLKWRHDEKIDNIHLEDFSDMASEFHVTVDTYDKTGRPIGVIDMFDWDIRREI
ncbi:SEC14-like protein 2, partial [Orchesella cincta]